MKIRLAISGLLLGAVVVSGAEIRLSNGQVYQNATVVSRTSSNLEIQVQYGKISLALGDVDSIDGVPLRVAPRSSASRVIVSRPAPVVVTIPALPPPSVPYVHNFKMDIFLVAVAVVVAAWLLMVLWVQRDVSGPAVEIRRANADVLLLPGLGFLMYLIARYRRHHQPEEPEMLTNRIAGLKDGEAPKKRGLFGSRAVFASAFRSNKQNIAMEFLDANRDVIQVRKDMPEMTGIEAAREVLEGAIAERASDIHIEPHDAGCRIRFRIDGVLQQRMNFDRTEGLRVSTAIKALAQVDIAEKRRAQDGRFRVRTANGEVDFRVATVGSIYGEKLVLRILDRQSGLLALTDLGMSQSMLAHFDRVIHSRNGIILATGPTGSGKTSTLYAAISRLDAKKLNIMTIEDPVEYELDGATQMAVNLKAGITYEAGLRSILRQDPDVIFVGEIRDKDAATIAVRAALTGHLVFSSLHTQDAPGSVARLAEMGVEPYQISSALLMVVGQRLVRILCPACRAPYPSVGNELAEVGLELPAGRKIYRAVGCDECEKTGYQGRSGIFELLVVDDAMRRAITDGADQQQLTLMARAKGYRAYREDGVEKILSGVTSVDEIIQST